MELQRSKFRITWVERQAVPETPSSSERSIAKTCATEFMENGTYSDVRRSKSAAAGVSGVVSWRSSVGCLTFAYFQFPFCRRTWCHNVCYVSGNEHTCFPTSYELAIQDVRQMSGRAVRSTQAAQAQQNCTKWAKNESCCIAGCKFVNYAPV